MSALSPKTRDLIARGRGGPPSATDRARVRAKLDERLALVAAAAAVGGAAKVASAAAASMPTAGVGTAVVAAQTGTFGLSLKIGLAVLVLGAAGMTYQVVRSSHATPAASSASAAPLVVDAPANIDTSEKIAPMEQPSPLASSTASTDDKASTEASASPTDSAATDPSPSVAASAGRLPKGHDPASIAGEVAMLRRAQSALAKGDPNASLRAIDAIETSHPSGALREETSAARVLALCAAGKTSEAKAEAARFLAQWPSSVQAGRVRGSCAFAPDTSN
jgi:hypothetical protein